MRQGVTIIIPTYRRPRLLARLLRYYRDVQLDDPVVVADSSPEPEAWANQQMIRSVQQTLDITYQQYEPTIWVELKIARALDVIDTPYTVLCADDDFLIPRGIAACVAFLESHPDYAIASGRAVAVMQPGGPNDLFGALYEGWYTRSYPQRTLESADPMARLLSHMSNYTTTFYSVHRRADMVRNIQLATQYTDEVRFGELVLSCLSVIQGKVHCLDTLTMVRQFLPDSAAQQATSWATLLTNDDYSQRYTLFRTCLATELVRATTCDSDTARAVVNRAFLAYLPTALGLMSNQVLPHQVAQYAMKALGVFREMVSDIIFDGAWMSALVAPHLLYRRARARDLMRADSLSLDALFDPRSPYHGDFLPVYRQLKEIGG
jgi:glycosyltransferase domain-containing protein